MSYQEQLQHPSWQRRRLDVLQRDDFTCVHCGSTEKTLTVHHRYYKKNEDGSFNALWDYPDDCFLTLCEDCHAAEEARLKELMAHSFFILREHIEDAKAISELLDYITDTHLAIDKPTSLQQLLSCHEDYLLAHGWVRP